MSRILKLLRKLYPGNIKELAVKIECTFERSPKAYLVYATTAATVLLWTTSSIHGVNSYTVALLPVIVFSLSGIIDTNDIKKINWDVLCKRQINPRSTHLNPDKES